MTSKVFKIIEKEKQRQNNTVELIASENFVSDNVLLALGSCLTNKYSEGYPEHRTSGRTGRYYGGCQYIDELEEYCCDKWKEVFHTDYHVNVQPHSGTQANMAAYFAVLKPGDTILSMSLESGGHLSHGSKVNFSGKIYNIVSYGVDKDGFIDYNDLKEKIYLYRPQLILAGASAYSRTIDFELIWTIISDVKTQINQASLSTQYNPIFMVDMAHIAGLVAAGAHISPFGWADIITTTTHKTLRGPRGGLIFCKPELANKIDSAVFPCVQGGPIQNIIAAKAVAAEEACTKEFNSYIWNAVKNAAAMANRFKELGYDVVTGGTDNHLFLLDFTRTHPDLTGLDVQKLLDKNGITLNKNCVPNEKRSPKCTSGVRIGTAAMTSKGYTADDFIRIADIIDYLIRCYLQERPANND